MVARRAHNPKVVGSNPTPATKKNRRRAVYGRALFFERTGRGIPGREGLKYQILTAICFLQNALKISLLEPNKTLVIFLLVQ